MMAPKPVAAKEGGV